LEEDDATPWHSDERMERYNSLFPILPEFVAHYTVGLKRGGTPDIGTEYAKRRYTEETDQSRWLGLTDRIDLIYEEARKYLSWYFSFQKDQIDGDELSYRDLSSQFFYRNLGSLDAAKRLAELGYLCEVASVLRSALEQFAFWSRLSSLTGTEDPKAIRPIQCLNHFKKFVPWGRAIIWVDVKVHSL
jgi:hypothetical protein